MNPIAHIRTCYPEKFGTPRQSGLVPEANAQLIFEPQFRNPDALRGLEGFSHVWLIWQFHLAERNTWSPTVRPPRLGGNTRMGVFATRSPFRPNPIGLSAVKLIGIDDKAHNGPILHLGGVDLIDGTPILDIKPYLPFADSIPDARGGFAATVPQKLSVHIPDEFYQLIPRQEYDLLIHSLELDPRPSYHEDPERIYGMTLGSMSIHFKVRGDTLTITDITPFPL